MKKLIVLAALFAARPALSQGFACADANQLDERAICEAPRLAQADEEMSGSRYAFHLVVAADAECAAMVRDGRAQPDDVFIVLVLMRPMERDAA